MPVSRDGPIPGSIRAQVVDYVWTHGPVEWAQIVAAVPGAADALPAVEARGWVERKGYRVYDRPAAVDEPFVLAEKRGPGRPRKTDPRPRTVRVPAGSLARYAALAARIGVSLDTALEMVLDAACKDAGV